MAEKIRALNQGIKNHRKLQLRDVGPHRLPKGLKLSTIGCHKTETGLWSVRLEKDEVESTWAWVVGFDSSIWCCQKSKRFHTKNWKFTFWLKAHHSFDHLDAGFNLWGYECGILLLACLNGHEAAIPDSPVDALLQEVGKSIKFGSCASSEVACLTCCGKDITNFVMKPRTSPKTDMACLVDAAQVMGKSQKSASTLHCLLFVFHKWGEPIIRHNWFIARCPESLAERTSVIVVSSKYRDAKTC